MFSGIAAGIRAIAIAALPGLLCTAAPAQEQSPYLPAEVEIDLPSEVESRTYRYRMDFYQNAPGSDYRVSLDLTGAEVGATGYLITIDVIPSDVSGCPISSMKVANSGRIGRSFKHYATRRISELPVTFLLGDGEVWDPTKSQACDVVITVSRTITGCFMSAQVFGDIDALVFGQVAYFNVADEQDPLAAMIDPGTLDLLDGLIGEAVIGQQAMYGDGDSDEVCDDAGENCESLPDAPLPSFGDALGAWAAESAAAGDDMPPGFGDLFGIAMSDATFTDSDVMNLVSGGMPSFSLGGSSNLVSGDGMTSGIRIPLSTLYLLPGEFDANYSGVKFLYVEGETPGSAKITIHGGDFSPEGARLIVGRIDGELRSERRYEGGYLHVGVVATFVARRGALACQGQ